ncbi:hypothetical protein [Bacillus cereus]|uniref:HTH merR-type domain-containing protein n=1 Tax=Bacillus cereus TaxID=1396 RepID=A0A164QC00_BACCE|nr:hypothetical protein [Bacillus cereus]KZD70937.1 hypothetical protein B4088_0993 [Bacillus cereus]
MTDINRPDPNLINEYIYSTKEVAEKIGIKDVTVRKYSQALEKHGYQIFKDGNDRKFYERDIEVLKRLSAGVFENNKKLKLEDAARFFANQQLKESKGNISPTNTGVSSPDMNKGVSEGDMNVLGGDTEGDKGLTQKNGLAVHTEEIEIVEEIKKEYMLQREMFSKLQTVMIQSIERENRKDELIEKQTSFMREQQEKIDSSVTREIIKEQVIEEQRKIIEEQQKVMSEMAAVLEANSKQLRGNQKALEANTDIMYETRKERQKHDKQLENEKIESLEKPSFFKRMFGKS